LVPALIPTFLKGHIRGEEENWIVRGFINVYKPLLTWALERRTFVTWAFAALLILAAGMFPLQAVLGRGAARRAWEVAFYAATAFVLVVVGVLSPLALYRQCRPMYRGWDAAGSRWTFPERVLGKALALLALVPLAHLAYHFP